MIYEKTVGNQNLRIDRRKGGAIGSTPIQTDVAEDPWLLTRTEPKKGICHITGCDVAVAPGEVVGNEGLKEQIET